MMPPPGFSVTLSNRRLQSLKGCPVVCQIPLILEADELSHMSSMNVGGPARALQNQ